MGNTCKYPTRKAPPSTFSQLKGTLLTLVSPFLLPDPSHKHTNILFSSRANRCSLQNNLKEGIVSSNTSDELSCCSNTWGERQSHKHTELGVGCLILFCQVSLKIPTLKTIIKPLKLCPNLVFEATFSHLVFFPFSALWGNACCWCWIFFKSASNLQVIGRARSFPRFLMGFFNIFSRWWLLQLPRFCDS